jgi:hypothetical protein
MQHSRHVAGFLLRLDFLFLLRAFLLCSVPLLTAGIGGGVVNCGGVGEASLGGGRDGGGGGGARVEGKSSALVGVVVLVEVGVVGV